MQFGQNYPLGPGELFSDGRIADFNPDHDTELIYFLDFIV